jgi:hypothetical protein
MMNKAFLDLIDDNRTPDELKAKLVMLAIKMQKLTNVADMKAVLLLMIDVLTDVEKVQEQLNAKVN